MTKNELVQELARVTSMTQTQIESVLRNLAKTVGDKLKNGEKVAVTGFGTFDVTNRSSRKVRNPMTGDWMKVPEMKMPKFRAGESLKRSVR